MNGRSTHDAAASVPRCNGALPAAGADAARPPARRRKPGNGKILLALLVGIGVAVLLGFFAHRNAQRAGESGTVLPAAPVAVVRREDLSKEVSFDAEFRPYQEVAVHAKVAGYVKEIDVDIGDHVKAGQVLATLEVPELKDDLRKASAGTQAAKQEVARAQADADDAHLASSRLAQVGQAHPNLIAQQDLDTAQARDQAAAAALQAAQSNVDVARANESRMLAMLDYCLIPAPFDGVITHRYADTGALVQAGTASNVQALPVVTLAEDGLLRLDFPVQESVVPLIRVGQAVEVTVDALGETFPAKVTRFTDKVDMATRTMITEVEVPNPDLRYKPGMYASVRLVIAAAPQAISIPIQALAGPEQKEVLVLGPDHKIERRAVQAGLQTADRVEIKQGLREGEAVILAPGSRFKPGERATAKVVEP